MAEKKSFNLGGYLESKGLEFSRVGEDGKYYINTAEGEEKAFDVPGFLKSKGLEGADFRLNSPETATDDSPISITDRAKLALDSTKSQLNYYKNKFQDAAYTEDKGVVVKDKGVWKSVDPSSMDPWELTKDIIEGGIKMAPGLVGGTAGAVGGTIAAGPVGGVVGAGAGAGAARAVLGRLLGTAQRDPENELKEVGWEILLNAGGQGLALGVKPLMGKFLDAAKSLKRIPDASKDVMAEVLGRTTGAGAEAMNVLMEAPETITKKIAKSVVEYGSEQGAVHGLKNESLRNVERLVKESPTALSEKYGELVKKLASEAPKDFVADFDDIAKSAKETIRQSGLGKLVENESLVPLTNKESLKRIIKGETGHLLDDTSSAAISKMFKHIDEISGAGSSSGPTGVKALMELKRSINQAARNVADSATVEPTVKKFVGDIQSAVVNEIGAKFSKNKMAESYVATSNLYKRFADSVEYARKVQNQIGGEEVLLNKLASGVGRNSTYKDLAGDMAELLGDKGKSILNNIRTNDAASRFVTTLPKVTLGSLSIGTAASTAVATGFLPPVALAGAAMSSPRLVAEGAKRASQAFGYAKQFSDFVGTMTPAMRMQWLNNPEALNATIRLTVDAMGQEQKDAEQLLQGAGVK